jgi:multicomponent Na+:H+ antiporter subunit E
MTAFPVGPVAMRSAFFLFCWSALGIAKPMDVFVGLVVAVPIAVVSLTLLPSNGRHLRVGRVPWFCVRFATRSFAAGIDVARRVLGRTVDLNPGICRVPCQIPEGLLRQGFCAVASLQPGTIPVGWDDDGILVHSLDVSGPIESELNADADAFLAISESE